MFSLEEMVVTQLARKTGFLVQVGLARGNLFTGRFHLQKVEIGNPPAFPVRDFISVVEAKASISPGSLLGKTVRVRELDIHLRQVTGIRSASGAVNIAQFREGLERREPGEPGGQGGGREVHIARLNVKVDQIATVDFTQPSGDRREYPILFEREFLDVLDVLSLGPPLLAHCAAAGLSLNSDTILSTLLPDFLWTKIGNLMPRGST